jgi:ribosomal protein S18 acetylase RimI-like enzyme
MDRRGAATGTRLPGLAPATPTTWLGLHCGNNDSGVPTTLVPDPGNLLERGTARLCVRSLPGRISSCDGRAHPGTIHCMITEADAADSADSVSAADTAFEIRRAVPEDWAALRRVRLAALAEAPYAFGSTLDGEIGCPEQFWRARIAASPQFIAWAGGEPVGIAAGFAERASNDDGRSGSADGASSAGGASDDGDSAGGASDDGDSADESGHGEPAHSDGASGSWHLVSMWVSPRARGRGIADELVAAVCDCARADGAQRLTLWVTDVNARAQAFYQRLGFRSTGRRQLVRPDEPDHWEQEQVLDLR